MKVTLKINTETEKRKKKSSPGTHVFPSVIIFYWNPEQVAQIKLSLKFSELKVKSLGTVLLSGGWIIPNMTILRRKKQHSHSFKIL